MESRRDPWRERNFETKELGNYGVREQEEDGAKGEPRG